MKPLRIVSFLDGRMGHEKQTKGIIQALAEMTPISVEQKLVAPPNFQTGLKNWLLYIFCLVTPNRKTGRFVDLIVGTGTGTHIPMLLYKKKCGARVVTCMTPDFLLKKAIDLCLVPRHDRQRTASNIFFTTGPPNNVVFCNRHGKHKGLVLVGGVDPKSHHWRSETLTEQIGNILARNQSITWTISSSPRTPPDTLVQLENLASQQTRVTFLRAEDTPEGWIEEQYAKNDKVWVTADSMSMIFEALTAGCRVGILPVEWKQKNSKFQKSLDDLLEKGWVLPYREWLAGQDLEVRGARLDEASRCAREILRRWWPERLP